VGSIPTNSGFKNYFFEFFCHDFEKHRKTLNTFIFLQIFNESFDNYFGQLFCLRLNKAAPEKSEKGRSGDYTLS
jgi:hypothetical protein